MGDDIPKEIQDNFKDVDIVFSVNNKWSDFYVNNCYNPNTATIYNKQFKEGSNNVYVFQVKTIGVGAGAAAQIKTGITQITPQTPTSGIVSVLVVDKEAFLHAVSCNTDLVEQLKTFHNNGGLIQLYDNLTSDARVALDGILKETRSQVSKSGVNDEYHNLGSNEKDNGND